jgi:hypothetical protein
MYTISAQNGRLNYENAIKMVIDANFAPRDAKGNITGSLTKEQYMAYRQQINEQEITPGFLRTEATLQAGQSYFTFPIVSTQQVSGSPITPTMRLLAMQDSFVATELSYTMCVYNMTGGNQANINFSGGSNWLPITYPSPYDNNGSDVDWAPGTAMLWIGSTLYIEVNKKVVIPALDCARFLNVPQTQATPNFDPKQAFFKNTKNQLDFSTDSFYPLEPNIVFGGGRDNNVRLNLPSNIPDIAPFNNASYNDTFVVKAVLNVRGILVQNSTFVK